MLQMLECNSTLLALRLDGNHIPEDTLRAIQARIERNINAHEQQKRDQAKTTYLNTELKSIAKASQNKITALQDRLAEQDKENRSQQKSLTETVTALKCDVQVRQLEQ